MLCVWRPTAPPSQPALSWLELDAAPQERVELRTWLHMWTCARAAAVGGHDDQGAPRQSFRVRKLARRQIQLVCGSRVLNGRAAVKMAWELAVMELSAGAGHVR